MVARGGTPKKGGGDYGDLMRLSQQEREEQSRTKERSARKVRRDWLHALTVPSKKLRP